MSRLCRHYLIGVSGTVLDGISPAALAHYIVACHRGGTTDGRREHLLFRIRDRKFSAPMTAATSPSCGQPPVGADEWSAHVLNDVATMPALSHRRKWHRFGWNFTRCASPLYCCMPQGRNN